MQRIKTKQGTVWLNDMPLLIASVQMHSLLCYPLSNAFEAVMHAYCHLANGTDTKMGQTDRESPQLLCVPTL